MHMFCRRFVERDLFDDSSGPPEKHNLSLYPTVNDLQNHIHQALHDIESGVLPVTAPTVSIYELQNMNINPHHI